MKEGGKEEQLLFVKKIPGRDAREVLPAILASTLRALAFPKRMSWDAWLDDGKGAFPFGRPIRWVVALLGGAVAASSHLTKTSTRALANTSPEPFSNWFLSLGEDAFVVGLGYLAMQHPLAALIVASVLLVFIAAFAVVIVRTVRRWFFRRTPAAA
jgi:hypothetical protein